MSEHTATDIQPSIHHLLYEVLMAYGLYLDLKGKPDSPRTTEWYRLAAEQEALMMHIRVLIEAFFFEPKDDDFHAFTLVDRQEWITLYGTHAIGISAPLDKRKHKEASFPPWSLYSKQVAHLAKVRTKGHEMAPPTFTEALTLLLPFVDKYLDAAKQHLKTEHKLEPAETLFEEWYSHIRSDDLYDTKLLGACLDTVSKFKALMQI